VLLLAGLLSGAPALHAQAWSEDPSNATTSLTSNVNDALAPALPSSCTGASLNGPFYMGDVSGTTAPGPTLPYAPCAYAPNVPVLPAPPKDMWFRLDPAFGDAMYRFFLVGTGAPAMAQGGMAVYEAPNASGPFRLLDCSSGGALTNTLPAVEASCITPGNKLFLRVWDRSTPAGANTRFNICVRGQRSSTLPDRGADESPCAARTITAVGVFSSATTLPNTQYAYACDEPGLLHTTPEKAGGDLWVKLQVPPTGHVIIKAAYATVPANQIGTGAPVVGNMGISAYLATDCSDYNTFKEVGSATTLVTPAGSTAASANLSMQCLPAGAWVYVRFYALKEALLGTKVKRFGTFRFEWMNGPLPYPAWTPADRPANCDPCGALDLVVDAACTGATVAGGNTVGACSAPGIPSPTCGNYSSATPSVWHKFIAPASGTVQIDAAGSTPPAIDPAIALYTSNDQGCNGRMVLLACDDRQGPGTSARIIKWGLVPGQTYYVRTWSRTTQGNFSLCVAEPVAPPDSCLYMIDLWGEYSTTAMSMDVSINGGPATTYTPTGGDCSQTFLVPVPIGASADFSFNGPSTGYRFWSLWQVGRPDSLAWYDGGYSMLGPAPVPRNSYHLASACGPFTHPASDCKGMRTLCLNLANGPPYYTSGSTMDNRPKPRHISSNSNTGAYSGYGSQTYEGYTYNQANGNTYDLAGANLGCLDPESNGVEWRVIRPQANGTIAFLLNAWKAAPLATGTVDLDFAIWDLGPLVYSPGPDTINGDLVCPPQTAPVRCSSARRRAQTGLVPGYAAQEEGHGGWGYVAPLPVLNGNGYLLAIQPVDTIGAINYTVNWTLYEDALGVSDPSIISCVPLVLPVELLFLAGLARDQQVDLTWATATERNSSHFVVERSPDGFTFSPIGQVAAAGNSQYRLDYTFTDTDPFTGVNYYRLRMVDLDGATELSNVIAVAFTGQGGKVAVYPNPVHDRLNLLVHLPEASAVTVRILDATGRMVQESHHAVERGDQRLGLDAALLAPGAYLVQLAGVAGNDLTVARFVKD